VRIARIAVGKDRRAAAERRQGRQMRARRGADERDAARIDAERAGAAAHELHGGDHVLDRLRKRLMAFLGEAVADGKHCVAVRGEMRAAVLECAPNALLPATPMHRHQSRRAAARLRQVKVALQFNPVMDGVGQCGTQFKGSVGHGECSGSWRWRAGSQLCRDRGRLARSFTRRRLGVWFEKERAGRLRSNRNRLLPISIAY